MATNPLLPPHTKLLNNYFVWDGSELGGGEVIDSWYTDGDLYYLIYCYDRGYVICQANRTSSTFPCIIEDIRILFDLPRRGTHRIIMASYHWILYYVPLSSDQKTLSYETHLSNIPNTNSLRSTEEFRYEMARLLVFQEVLSITQTSETNIRLRSVGDLYLPISYGEMEKTVKQNKTVGVLSKIIFNRWLTNEWELTNAAHALLQHPEPYTEAEWLGFCATVRSEVERINSHYDGQFLWLASCITARLSNLVRIVPDL
jgi:hypothetical protein